MSNPAASRPFRLEDWHPASHLHESVIRRAVHEGSVGTKPAPSHTFRHLFAAHLVEDGYDIRTVPDLLGHKGVETAMVYTRVWNRGGSGVHGPLDRLRKAVALETGNLGLTDGAAWDSRGKCVKCGGSLRESRSCGRGWLGGCFVLGRPGGFLGWSGQTGVRRLGDPTEGVVPVAAAAC